MHYAAGNGHEEVVLCLMHAGADAGKCDKVGRTCLPAASERGHEDVVQTLMQAPIDTSQFKALHVDDVAPVRKRR